MVHYFSLAGLTWIFLEATMLYLKLIAVYDGEFVRMKHFLLVGWGMCAIYMYICGLCIGDYFANYVDACQFMSDWHNLAIIPHYPITLSNKNIATK